MINWFLDMCIPIYYASQEDYILVEKAKEFVKNKKENLFVTCFYVLENNLPKWIERQRTIIKEVEFKIKNSDYEIGASYQSRILNNRDKRKGDKFFISYLNAENKEEFLDVLKIKQLIMEQALDYFIKHFINKKVIPISEIDFELKSSLFTYLNSNDSDARTLASAVQQHNKELITVLTGDAKHWTKELLNDAVSIHPTLRKKYSKIPEIKYLQNL